MKKTASINIAILITFIVLSFGAYYLLLQDNFLQISISSIIAKSHGLETTRHLLILGLLPFYIAAVVFGTAVLSFYIGSYLYRYSLRIKNKSALNKA